AEGEPGVLVRARELGQQAGPVSGPGDRLARLRRRNRLAADGFADRHPFRFAPALGLRQNVDDVRPDRDLRSPDLDRADLRVHLRVQSRLVLYLQLMIFLPLAGVLWLYGP